MSGHNTSSSSHGTEASRENSEAGDNQSDMRGEGGDLASNQSSELESGPVEAVVEAVSLNKLGLVILLLVNS